MSCSVSVGNEDMRHVRPIRNLNAEQNFRGSNTDGSFTTAFSNLFMNPQNCPMAIIIIIFGITSGAFPFLY